MTRPRTLTTGLAICGVLAAVDVLGLAGAGMEDAPPLFVVILGAVFGVVTLAALRPALAGQAMGVRTVVWSRALSALWGLPVYFVDDAPVWAKVAVGACLALTAVGLALIYAAQRDESYTAARA